MPINFNSRESKYSWWYDKSNSVKLPQKSSNKYEHSTSFLTMGILAGSQIAVICIILISQSFSKPPVVMAWLIYEPGNGQKLSMIDV